MCILCLKRAVYSVAAIISLWIISPNLQPSLWKCLELMCVKRVDGGKKAQPPIVTGDVDMNEDMAPETSEEQQQSTEKWSLYCSLSPLGEKLLSISVSFPQKYYDTCGRIHVARFTRKILH